MQAFNIVRPLQKVIICSNSRPEENSTPQLPFGNEEVKFFDNAEVGQRIAFIHHVFLILQRSYRDFLKFKHLTSYITEFKPLFV